MLSDTFLQTSIAFSVSLHDLLKLDEVKFTQFKKKQILIKNRKESEKVTK